MYVTHYLIAVKPTLPFDANSHSRRYAYYCKFNVPVMIMLRIHRREEKKQGGQTTRMPPISLSNDLPHDAQEALPPFETFYDHYHVQVYRYLYAHLKHEQDAADLMQQVFFQAWKKRQTYNPERGTIATWLLGIA